MSDKTGKIGGKKIGGVKQTTQSDSVDGAESVDDVGSVKKAGGVGGVSGTSRAGNRGTRTMTMADREKLFSMVSDEAEKLFKKGQIPAEQREVIEEAVKMAIDAGLLEEEEEQEKNSQ
jgi:hypothetical protein